MSALRALRSEWTKLWSLRSTWIVLLCAVVFSADTLFNGGPGATGRSFSSFPTIIESIRTKLLTLPDDTVVNTGHGDDTRIGDEAPQLEEWIARGS